jgi:hypothetical protein
MPKLRAEDIEGIDVDYLDSIEYSTEEFDRYDGDVPPVGLTLSGYTKKIWWTRSAKDDAMLKILWIADENEGDLEEYNGCPFWLNASLIGGAKFKWAPWMEVYGFTLRKVLTTTYVSKKEDQNGAPVERIGSWKPGAESDAAWCYIVTDQEPYNGVMRPQVKEWIAWDDFDPDAAGGDGEAAEPEGEDGEDGLLVNEDGDLVDEDGNLVDEDGNLIDEEGNLIEDEGEDGEDEPPEDEPPARTGRRAARSTPARTPARTAQPARAARTASKPATARTGRRTPARAASPAPARSARSTATPARSRTAKAAAAAAPARSTRTKRRGTDNDPPF